MSRKKVTRNPITGTIRIPEGVSYNLSRNTPKPSNGCVVTAVALASAPVGFFWALGHGLGIW